MPRPPRRSRRALGPRTAPAPRPRPSSSRGPPRRTRAASTPRLSASSPPGSTAGGWTMRALRRIWGICTRPAARRQPPPLAVAAVRRAARATGEEPPAWPLTRAGPRGLPPVPRPPTPPPAAARARGLTAEECAAVLATCHRPRRTGRGLERVETAERRGLVDAAIVALLFHGGAAPQRGGDSALGRRRARRRWRRRRHRRPLEDESGRRSSRRPAPGRQLRGRGPSPAGGGPRRNPAIPSSVSVSTR